MPSGYDPDEDPFVYVDKSVLNKVIESEEETETEVEETKTE